MLFLPLKPYVDVCGFVMAFFPLKGCFHTAIVKLI